MQAYLNYAAHNLRGLPGNGDGVRLIKAQNKKGEASTLIFGITAVYMAAVAFNWFDCIPMLSRVSLQL